MNEYLFVLGRAPQLSKAEIESVLKRLKINYELIFSSLEILHIKTTETLDANFLIKTLGGTVKIAQVFGCFYEEKILLEAIVDFLKKEKKGMTRIIFGLSFYNNFLPFNFFSWHKILKEKMLRAGFKVRFILPKNETSLSSVVVKKQKVLEIIIVKEQEKFIVANTLIVQDFEEWGRRDFGRPIADPKKGMLPPKIARMMINIGIPAGSQMSKLTMVDPFCGTGTILAEGLMLGLNVIGSDKDKSALEATKRNLEWLKNTFVLKKNINYRLLEQNATHLSCELNLESIDLIVTEPYLGPAMTLKDLENKAKDFKNIILGLEKLYLGCLKDWRKILKTGGKLVIVFPSFKIGYKEIFVKKPIDFCENLGYTLEQGPVQYFRPQAIVIRNIYIFKRR